MFQLRSFAIVAVAIIIASFSTPVRADSKPSGPVVPPGATVALALVPTDKMPSRAVLEKDLASLERKGVRVSMKVVRREGLPGLDREVASLVTRGLTDTEREQFARPEKVVLLLLGWKPGDSEALRAGYRAVRAIAGQHRLLILDVDAMEAFSASGWEKLRLEAGWRGEQVVAPRHFNVQLVAQENGLVMLDTSGLARFGLAELVLNGASRNDTQAALEMINVIAQRLVEGARPNEAGNLRIRLSEIRESGMRERVLASSFENRKGEVMVRLVTAEGEEEVHPDALEVRFPELECKSQGECLDQAVTQLFGWEDEVRDVKHDQELLAAKNRALKQLKGLRPAFEKGLPGGEFLLVKARFPHDEGNEWMWVEVHGWKGDTITGRLESKPQYARQVKSGQTVTVSWQDVMDYMHMFEEGTFVGNETGKVISPEVFEDAGKGRSRIRR